MKSNPPVHIPGAGASETAKLVQLIEGARAGQSPIVVVDRPGFLVAGDLPIDGDVVLDGSASWPWSLFIENLQPAEIAVFVDALLPSKEGPSAGIEKDARALLADLISALQPQISASHSELRRLLQDAPLSELATVLADRKSVALMQKANQLRAESVRAAAAEAVRNLPISSDAITLSLRSIAPGAVIWLRGCAGAVGEAMAALALTISSRQPRIIFSTKPACLPECLKVASKTSRFMEAVTRLSAVAEAVHSTVRGRVASLLVHEVNTPDWTPPRAGWKLMRLGRAELAPHAETAHILFIGAPGTGKSVGIFSLMDQVRDYNQGGIVYDSKGEFIKRYYDPSRGDIILSPVDERSPSWNLFDELSSSFDLDKVAAALIEEPKSGDKYWVDNARIVLRDILTALKARGETTNAALFHAAAKMDLTWMPTEGEMEGWKLAGMAMGLKDAALENHILEEKEKAREMDLQTLLKGMQAANLVNPNMGKTAPIIRSQLSASMAAWAFLRDQGPRFNITEFIRNPRGRFLFLPSRSDMQSMLKPLITLWMELAANAQLALPTNRPDHRLYFCIDELPGLQKLASLAKLMAEGRGYGACVVSGIQLVSQHYEKYGKEAGETLLGLHSTLIAYRTKEPTSAEFMSKAFGNRIARQINRSRTISANDDRDQITLTEQRTKEALLIEGDFIGLPTLQAYMSSPDRPTVLVKFTPSSRRPGGTDEWRDADGLPLSYALRDDITIDAYVAAATQAAESEEKLEKVAQGDDFDALFGPQGEWTADALLRKPTPDDVAPLGAAVKERAQAAVDPDTGEILDLADVF